MYIRELDALIAVAEQGSFLQAAKELYITPASVMNQVNKLERLVGVQLVDRTNQGTKLTAAGKSLYEDTQRIKTIAAQAMENARRAASAECNTIRVGSSLLRPCRSLMNLWDKCHDDSRQFHIRIVPFEDAPESFNAVLKSLGTQIDCIVSPCDSVEWQHAHSIQLLGELPCRVALPRSHRLANCSKLTWNDLDGETFMLRQRGDSPILDRMRDEILRAHPGIHIHDALDKYDAEVFNECAESGCLMESLDIWTDVHPSLVTIPMEWDYVMPYGIIYPCKASPAVSRFVELIAQHSAEKSTQRVKMGKTDVV